MPPKGKASPNRRRVLVGISYNDKTGEEKRAEPGDVVDDIPVASLKWLDEQGHVEKVEEEVDK